jgi:hypothetical protein
MGITMSLKIDIKKLNEGNRYIRPLFDAFSSIIEANIFVQTGKLALANNRLETAENHLLLAKYHGKIQEPIINRFKEILEELRKAIGQPDIWYYQFIINYYKLEEIILIAYIELIKEEEKK